MDKYYSWQATNKREPLQKLIQKQNKHTENYMLIKILYCGLCGSDLHLLEGQWDIKFPQTLGHEIIGVVVKLSKKRESDHQIGDIVGVG